MMARIVLLLAATAMVAGPALAEPSFTVALVGGDGNRVGEGTTLACVDGICRGALAVPDAGASCRLHIEIDVPPAPDWVAGGWIQSEACAPSSGAGTRTRLLDVVVNGRDLVLRLEALPERKIGFRGGLQSLLATRLAEAFAGGNGVRDSQARPH